MDHSGTERRRQTADRLRGSFEKLLDTRARTRGVGEMHNWHTQDESELMGILQSKLNVIVRISSKQNIV